MARVPSQQKKQKAMKLVARRLAILWLRKLLDYADEQVHAAEVRLRDDLSLQHSNGAGVTPRRENRSSEDMTHQLIGQGENFSQWEARRSGVTVSKKVRRRGMSAAEFDLRTTNYAGAFKGGARDSWRHEEMFPCHKCIHATGRRPMMMLREISIKSESPFRVEHAVFLFRHNFLLTADIAVSDGSVGSQLTTEDTSRLKSVMQLAWAREYALIQAERNAHA